MTTETFVGIEVSKAWLDVVVRPSGEHRRLANDEAGWAEIVAWLQQEARPLVVLEASGGDEQGLVQTLAGAGLAVTVGNPLKLRRWMQSQGQRAKTDRLDAAMLAWFAEERHPAPTAVADETARTVAALVTRRRQLSQMKAEEQTRLKQPGLLQAVRQQLAVLADDAAWQERVDQLVTVPGIAQLSAARLLAWRPELGPVSAKRLAALVGVAPYPHESGQHRGRQMISGGRRWVRHALYEVMTTTKRCDPTFRAHYAQLRERGKSHNQAMVACMRRRLGILTAMVRDGLTWQETDVGKGTFLPKAA